MYDKTTWLLAAILMVFGTFASLITMYLKGWFSHTISPYDLIPLSLSVFAIIVLAIGIISVTRH